MKYIISLIIIVFITSVTAISQERINTEELKFNKSSDTIYKAKGWVYDNINGKWISHDNLLSNEENNNNSGILESQIDQNFILFHSKMLSVGEKNYFVLFVKKFEGHYTYPSIRQDWNIEKKQYAYVFDENEFNKLKSSDSLIELSSKTLVSFNENISDNELINLIKLELSKTPYLEYTFPFKSTISNGVNVKRFYLPSTRKSKNTCRTCRKKITFVNGKWLNLSEPKKNKQDECYSFSHQADDYYEKYNGLTITYNMFVSGIYDFKYAYFEILDSEFLKIFPKN
jgi:hypothetical protein